MPVAPARSVAYRVLRRVESGRALAVDLLQSEEVSQLREVDRALVTELVMGVLRWGGELDFQIERLSGKRLAYFDPEIITILRLGLYQIRFLERIPKSAAVNEAVELVKAARKRSAAGIVNAVLRKCERGPGRPTGPTGMGGKPRGQAAVEPESGDSGSPVVLTLNSFSARDDFCLFATRHSSLATSSNLVAARGRAMEGLVESACRATPRWLLERWTQNYGPEAAKSLALASVSVPRTTVRVAASQAGIESLRGELAQEGISTNATQVARGALVVESGHVQGSRAWREGRVVIQDEASQLVATLLRVEPGQRVLDLTAAPGIKTGQLAGMLGRGVLVASDVSARRLADLNRLLPSHVPPEVKFSVVRLDATQPLPFSTRFDRVLLDAPCSGTGTLARHPEIKWRLRPEDLTRLAKNQARMLRHALEVLAPGGRLVYATCSLEPEENEQIVESVSQAMEGIRALSRDELAREIPSVAGLIDPRGYFRSRPDLHAMDGFFAAVLIRRPS